MGVGLGAAIVGVLGNVVGCLTLWRVEAVKADVKSLATNFDRFIMESRWGMPLDANCYIATAGMRSWLATHASMARYSRIVGCWLITGASVLQGGS